MEPYDIAMPLLGVYLEEMKTGSWRDIALPCSLHYIYNGKNRAKEYNNWNFKNTLDAINSRLNDIEEWVSTLKVSSEITQAKQKKEKVI